MQRLSFLSSSQIVSSSNHMSIRILRLIRGTNLGQEKCHFRLSGPEPRSCDSFFFEDDVPVVHFCSKFDTLR